MFSTKGAAVQHPLPAHGDLAAALPAHGAMLKRWRAFADVVQLVDLSSKFKLLPMAPVLGISKVTLAGRQINIRIQHPGPFVTFAKTLWFGARRFGGLTVPHFYLFEPPLTATWLWVKTNGTILG